MSRYFTLQEAQQLIPEIDALMDGIMQAKSIHDSADDEMGRITSRIQMMGGSMIHPGEILQLRSRKENATVELQKGLESVQSYGCLVKDLAQGLVDFPTLYHGEEVYLCWRKGEARIEHWHGVSEGFDGRKA